MLLNQTQISEITGYSRPSFQIQWLRRNGIRFLVGADGTPRVLMTHLEHVLGANPNQAPAAEEKAQPRFDALRRANGLV